MSRWPSHGPSISLTRQASGDGPGVAAGLGELTTIVGELVEAYPGVRRELRENVAEATRVAIAELLAFDLVRPIVDADGRTLYAVMPPLHRFRPVARRPRTDEQLGLFGESG